jgi:type IV secretory pathway VirB10-like protein
VADAADSKKNRNIIIAAAVMVIIVVIGVGVLVWSLGGNTDEKPNSTEYSTSTPGAAEAAQQPGDVDISPASVTMARGPDGRITGIATVSALFQNFTLKSIVVQGDPRVTLPGTGEGACKENVGLTSGTRCQVTLVLNETAPGTPTTTAPTLIISGTTLTPGGSSTPIEKRATITGVDPAAVAAAAAGGIPGAAGAIPGAGAVPGSTALPGAAGTPLTSGAVAGAGIDPYGPVAPTNGYSQQPQQNYAQNQAPQGLRPLSPREQFMLARRQAVLGNVVRTAQSQQPQQSTGDWDEIGVKKAVSSLPQDMSRVVTMDRIITAVLIRPFDSRQGQQVVAQVDRNVYGAMGRNILIPRGSTIIGNMAGGAERVAVVWTQIIRPDGARFVFQGTGGDAMGQSGVPGAVNNRWLSRIGASLLGTVIKIGTALASDPQETAGGGVISGGAVGGIGGSGNGNVARNKDAILVDITSQGINELLAPIIAQQKALLPIITVPGGTRLTIVPTQDLVMRPIQRETIVRPSYPRQMNGGAQISAPPEQQDGGEAYTGGTSPASYQTGQNQTQTQRQREASIGRSFEAPASASMGATPPWSSN